MGCIARRIFGFFVIFGLIGAVSQISPAKAQDTPEPPRVTLAVPALILGGVPVDIEASGLEGARAAGPFRLEGARAPVTGTREGEKLIFKDVVVDQGPVELVLRGAGGEQLAAATATTAPGWVSILPAVLAIVCVILVRQVVPALVLGIWLGAALAYGVGALGLAYGFLDILPVYALTALTNPDHVAIVIFTVMIGGMIGILSANGSMGAVARRIAALAHSPRGGQTASGSLGLLIFIDDYANALVGGNTMRPITDRLRVSREKLAYIVDSTAAPVSIIAIVTTWIGFMVSVIQEGVKEIDGLEANGYSLFLDSLPYGFYPLIAIGLVWLVALSGRDFGPMLTAERKARRDGVQTRVGAVAAEPSDAAPDAGAPLLAALVPLVILVAGTFLGIIATGLAAEPEAESLRAILGAGNPFTAMMWASLGGALSAAVLGHFFSGQTLEGSMEAWLEGAKSMVLPVVVLTLAWSLAEVNERVQTDDYLITLLGDALPRWLLPITVFVLSAGMAFTTGTSWGVMGIMTPLVMPLAWALTGTDMVAGDPVASAIFSATLASVLGGAVWGDHCSPISDTTVMSSLAAGCDHVEHVRTQLPYALLGGAATIVFGLLPVGLGAPWWLALPLSAGVTAGAFYYLSSPVEEAGTAAHAGPIRGPEAT